MERKGDGMLGGKVAQPYGDESKREKEEKETWTRGSGEGLGKMAMPAEHLI